MRDNTAPLLLPHADTRRCFRCRRSGLDAQTAPLWAVKASTRACTRSRLQTSRRDDRALATAPVSLSVCANHFTADRLSSQSQDAAGFAPTLSLVQGSVPTIRDPAAAPASLGAFSPARRLEGGELGCPGENTWRRRARAQVAAARRQTQPGLFLDAGSKAGWHPELMVQQKQPVLGTTDGSAAPDGGVKMNQTALMIRCFIPAGQFAGKAGLVGLGYRCRTAGELRV